MKACCWRRLAAMQARLEQCNAELRARVEALEETLLLVHARAAAAPAVAACDERRPAPRMACAGDTDADVGSESGAALMGERRKGRQLRIQLASSVRQLRAREAAVARLEREKAALRAQLLCSSAANAERDAVLVRVALPSP